MRRARAPFAILAFSEVGACLASSFLLLVLQVLHHPFEIASQDPMCWKVWHEVKDASYIKIQRSYSENRVLTLDLYSTCTFWMPTRGRLLIKLHKKLPHPKASNSSPSFFSKTSQILLSKTSIPWTSRGSFWRCSILPGSIL